MWPAYGGGQRIARRSSGRRWSNWARIAPFYSYDWLERAFGADVRNVRELRPEWQTLRAGDFVRATQPGIVTFQLPHFILQRRMMLTISACGRGSRVARRSALTDVVTFKEALCV
jgi:hypothetical protein